ncbi:hypothetical protein OAN96_00170 [Candidatus Gracilibacteria bacterium]|nr:hypothetical protein [Candidatus Gracilibacteria bacterium]
METYIKLETAGIVEELSTIVIGGFNNCMPVPESKFGASVLWHKS